MHDLVIAQWCLNIVYRNICLPLIVYLTTLFLYIRLAWYRETNPKKHMQPGGKIIADGILFIIFYYYYFSKQNRLRVSYESIHMEC